MNVQERLRKLENYANKKEEDKRRKVEEEKREEVEMIEQIKALEPRIQDLILVANSCLSKGISIENRMLDSFSSSHEQGHFVADAIRHHLGFSMHRAGATSTNYLEIRGGGYDDYNLKTDGVIVDVKGEKLYVLKKFLNEFDDFEKEFYAYVDRFINSHSIK